jgi:hypothetical protein
MRDDTMYKCPFCLHSFTKQEAKSKPINQDLIEYRCPSLKKINNPNRPCDEILPLNFFRSESCVISIIGDSKVGKTYFAMGLINLLQGSAGSILHKLGNVSIYANSFYPKEQEAVVQKRYEMIQNDEFIPTTQPGAERDILSIEVEILNKDSSKKIYLSFFDTPGELYKKYNTHELALQLPNIYKSDAIIFLLEPEQFNHLMPLINEVVSTDKINKDGYVILQKISDIIKHVQENRLVQKKSLIQFNLLNGKNLRSDIPFAFCLSKIDQIEKELAYSNEIPMEYPYNEHSLNLILKNDKINFTKIDFLSKQIESLLFQDNRFKGLVKSTFKDYSFFGVQVIKVSLKNKLDKNSNNKNGKYNIEMNQKGVMLPLLWVFKKMNLI